MLIDHAARYIALRRATGFKLTDAERVLRGFARFASDQGDVHVRSETAVTWASRSSSQLERHRRLHVVARFAEFLHAEDSLHQIPQDDLFFTRQRRSTPYIYSQAEIFRIVTEAAKLGPTGSLRPLAFSTMFGLMAVAGLRRCEVIELRISDLADDGLLIRETKFRKSRFVPLHATTLSQIERYLQERRLVAGQTDHLFVSLRRRKFAPHTVLTTFHEVCARAGIGRTLAGRQPRLHDLRHSFAVRALERSPLGHDSANRHMVALTTYMGHARVESTYWYLEHTPELLRNIADACESWTVGGAR